MLKRPDDHLVWDHPLVVRDCRALEPVLDLELGLIGDEDDGWKFRRTEATRVASGGRSMP